MISIRRLCSHTACTPAFAAAGTAAAVCRIVCKLHFPSDFDVISRRANEVAFFHVYHKLGHLSSTEGYRQLTRVFVDHDVGGSNLGKGTKSKWLVVSAGSLEVRDQNDSRFDFLDAVEGADEIVKGRSEVGTFGRELLQWHAALGSLKIADGLFGAKIVNSFDIPSIDRIHPVVSDESTILGVLQKLFAALLSKFVQASLDHLCWNKLNISHVVAAYRSN